MDFFIVLMLRLKVQEGGGFEELRETYARDVKEWTILFLCCKGWKDKMEEGLKDTEKH